ncbi:outer membrane porin, OprD family [Providencia stuartii]|uniref:Outer membrane porin, OprD family n=2 Tax=Providencia stuartii TaxID=588 RepID=A0AA86YFX8_PROST|nr:outer membrane porin, OprD family [Providencia stuartii ATCC 25827]MTC80738.1 outer membrane porin, OprD family [Providencia stuartii]MTC92877.1 outer membrane porin, OprD family [Providencia stuartii]
MANSMIKHTKKLLALEIFSILTASCYIPKINAQPFFDDATLKGGIYYWQRDRSRKELTPGSDKYGQYTDNLKHSSLNIALDFSSGYIQDFIGFDFAGYTAVELSNGGPAAPNEIGFSDAKNVWDEKGTGDRNGFTFTTAATKLKLGPFWGKAGYIQPSGQTLLATNWSFLPGTYRGAEVGAEFDTEDSGKFNISYMWTDQYKAPWYREMYEFREADSTTTIDYLHSLGVKYDTKNKLVLEGAVGQAEGYMDQYLAKISYAFPLAGRDLRVSYQFYGAQDKDNSGGVNDVYDGLAWLQAFTLGYTYDALDFQVEGTMVHSPGQQGYFLQRMTSAYGTSNGRIDVWWDARSDFNSDNEKALFAGVTYDLSSWDLAGWKIGTSYVYAWDAKPSNNPIYDQSQRVRESAWNFDILYTIQTGKAKDTTFKLHYTRFDNHSDIPSWGGGFNNIFQDEKDIKFIVTAPFTIF